MKTINWHIVALFFSFCWAQLKIYGLKTFVVCHASLYFDKSWTLPVCLNPDQTYCSLFCFAPVCTIGAYHLINLSLLKRGVQTFSSKDCIQIVDRRVQGPLDIFHLLFFSLKSIHLCWQRYTPATPSKEVTLRTSPLPVCQPKGDLLGSWKALRTCGIYFSLGRLEADPVFTSLQTCRDV